MGDLTEHFSRHEFACRHCGKAVVDSLLPQALEKLRTAVDAPLYVISGYRCATHNRAVRGAKDSQHVQGRAADVKALGVPLVTLYLRAEGIPEFGGIGLYPENGFVHVDVRTEMARWGRLGNRYVTLQKAMEALA
jgi:uncharacterized protein YcbK (DUF882 family)